LELLKEMTVSDTAIETTYIKHIRRFELPNWFRRRLLATFGSDDGWTCGASALETAWRRCPAIGKLLDGWGIATLADGQQAFVSEPRAQLEDARPIVESFARRIDCGNWLEDLGDGAVRILFLEPAPCPDSNGTRAGHPWGTPRGTSGLMPRYGPAVVPL
jgi:hypothetical protein